MEEPNLNQPAAVSRRFLPLLLPLFAASGCAALIYEIVWFQLLQLVIGSSAVSLGVLLGTFMGGMCLGSLALPRFISARRQPLQVYALLELGIGILGLVVLFAVPLLARFYVAGVPHGFTGILLRGVVCAVCLLPPTFLMGATLPALARWIEPTPRGVSWLGFFYGGNIAGAVFGCLLAGFYLLRVHDMATATYAAVSINAAVVLLAFALAARTTRESSSPQSAIRNPQSEIDQSLLTSAATKSVWPVYVAIALSGMSALGAEVVWTRLLSLLLGGTVYTFSIILAVFLLGLGLGSGAGSFLARGTVRPRLALGVCQLFLGAAMAWTAYMLAESIPYWPINPALSKNPWFNFQIDLVRCLWAILPATILWGASFPLALAALAARGQDAARLVGRVYAANTCGAIVGAIGTSMILVAWAGTQHAQQILIGLSVAAALLMLAPNFWPALKPRGRHRDEIHSQEFALRIPHSAVGELARALSVMLALGIAAWLAWTVPPVPWNLIAYGRHLATRNGEGRLLYVGEGLNASVAVTRTAGAVRNFHVSGKVEASTHPQDMRLQRMLGHIPALLHPKPRSALIVGCGAGVTAGSFLKHPGLDRIVICEIEPLIPQVVAQYFAKENYGVVQNPRVKIVYDDARHFVLTTPEKFDIITSDPIHPWVKGAATLYTQEYFEMCKRHLNPGGLVTQWVPLYESDLATVKSEIATFFAVFPDGTIWSNDEEGKGYDLVLLGPARPMTINVDEVRRRLERDPGVAESLDEVGIKSALGLLANFGGQAADLRPWMQSAEINYDRNLRLQYLAGLSVNSRQEESIYDEIVSYRKFSEKLFIGSEERKKELRKAFEDSPVQ